MEGSFLEYVQHLEMLAFFSGYPLLYAVVFFIAGNNKLKNNFKNRAVALLPFAYALEGALYTGLQIKKIYPHFSFETIHQPYLVLWGILSVLFWVPFIAKKPALTLIHSLVFFFFLVKDLYLQFSETTAAKDFISNDMRIYTLSILLNSFSLVFIILFSFLFTRNKKDSSFRQPN